MLQSAKFSHFAQIESSIDFPHLHFSNISEAELLIGSLAACIVNSNWRNKSEYSFKGPLRFNTVDIQAEV